MIVVIGSIGAVTRIISPFVKNKFSDPAVLVIDADAKFILPLLGSHSAGGEKLSLELADYLGGKAIQTGYVSSKGLLSLDSFGEDWGWKRNNNVELWRELVINHSKGTKILIEQVSGTNIWRESNSAKRMIKINNNQPQSITIGPLSVNNCSWHPPTLWVGIGCERNTSKSLLLRSLQETFHQAGLSMDAIAGLATIDFKLNEPALKIYAENEKLPIRTFSSEMLSGVHVPTPSEVVMNEVGTPSVSEAAAILASGEGGKLLTKKRIFKSNINEKGAVTVAVAESLHPFAPQRGELHLIGIGPGDLSSLTFEAKSSLARCVAWIGYSLYLDLLDPIIRDDQVRIESKLTCEKERCLQAIQLAQQGVKVALISSGDVGIYGMAGIALEMYMKYPESHRPLLHIKPGISAVQKAASLIGCPLMNDFCIISLSDLLTPWQVILKRIQGAIQGDFVVAFYNPKSKERYWQLDEAFKLLKENRSGKTPVALARQVGRKDEEIRLFTLDDLPLEQVDMLSVVVVGNSSSYIKEGVFITPRGYLN